MTDSEKTTQASHRSQRATSATHLFTTGQSVRLKNLMLPSGTVYRITASLPPVGASPQYRIRSEKEAFERMAAEGDLELVSPSAQSDGDASRVFRA